MLKVTYGVAYDFKDGDFSLHTVQATHIREATLKAYELADKLYRNDILQGLLVSIHVYHPSYIDRQLQAYDPEFD